MILSILFGLLCVFLALRYSYWRRHNIPFVPLKFPYIFGNVTKEKHQALQFTDFYKSHRSRAHDMNRPIIGVYMFLDPSVLIVDLELMRSILTENFAHFQNRGMFYNDRDDPLSAILGTLNHEKWRPLRTKLTPAFTPSKIKDMFPIMKTVGDELVKGLNEIIAIDNQVEIRKLFSRFTTDVIGKVAIGIQCNTLNRSTQLREMAKKAMEPYLKFPWNHLTIAHPDLARFLGIRKHSKEVSDFFVNVVEQTIQYRMENDERRNDYMQLLIDSGLSTKEIAALAFDLLSAGYADSTSTLAYCLYELALPNNKHIQHKARKEIQSVLGEHNGQLTYEVLNKMIYCRQIINETLRKHPVAGNATRIATKPFRVPNTDFTIPTGMRVFIPIYAVHHDAAFFPDPERFIPERFSEEPLPNAFLAFGAGPRKCIGFRFATLLVTVGLVSLLRNFEFSTSARTQIPIQYSSTKNTLIPSDGVWLKVDRI
ncbi:probable cytochrome P450 6a20 [Sitodiplosis mosellana]|uniref:probable cytochrome P450 6a20 n=1 Tax=Sitodiplosis mosellana TaxID=263140 RepID=UPI0024437A1F|nr:probable cytochrome P450 6a20 [Sitodiplosis mosellana]